MISFTSLLPSFEGPAQIAHSHQAFSEAPLDVTLAVLVFTESLRLIQNSAAILKVYAYPYYLFITFFLPLDSKFHEGQFELFVHPFIFSTSHGTGHIECIQ